MNSIYTLANESERLSLFNNPTNSKSTSPTSSMIPQDVSGWEDENSLKLSSLNPLKQTSRLKNPQKYSCFQKDLLSPKQSPSPNRLKSKNISTIALPEVISMYEVSKISSKYKQIFEEEKPFKNMRKSIKFPVINDKSLLSMYIPDGINKKILMKNEKKLEKRVSIFEMCRLGNKKYHSKQSGIPSGNILTIYSAINPLSNNFPSINEACVPNTLNEYL